MFQVEFLLQGTVLPVTMGEFRVSDNFLLEKGISRNYEHECTIAYFGTEKSEKENYFRTAGESVEFFVLVYCFIAGTPVTLREGVGIGIDSLESLGKRRVSFPEVEKLNMVYMGDPLDNPLTKPFLYARKMYLDFLPDRKKIRDSYLGIVLLYYYYAVCASETRRLDELFIDLMIAAEALLIKQDDSICAPLCNRLAALISIDATERIAICRTMRRLYDIRCGIVHGRGKKPTLVDARQLFVYVRKAIENAFSMWTLSKEEIVEKLDNEWTPPLNQ